jgi:hypothetical protein
MIQGLSIRLSVEADMDHWKRWVADPKVSRWFPFASEEGEIDRTARHVFSFLPRNAVLTAELDGKPCGIAGFELPEFRKIMHHPKFWAVVAESHRTRVSGLCYYSRYWRQGKLGIGYLSWCLRFTKEIRRVLSIRSWVSSILVFSPASATWMANSWDAI